MEEVQSSYISLHQQVWLRAPGCHPSVAAETASFPPSPVQVASSAVSQLPSSNQSRSSATLHSKRLSASPPAQSRTCQCHARMLQNGSRSRAAVPSRLSIPPAPGRQTSPPRSDTPEQLEGKRRRRRRGGEKERSKEKRDLLPPLISPASPCLRRTSVNKRGPPHPRTDPATPSRVDRTATAPSSRQRGTRSSPPQCGVREGGTVGPAPSEQRGEPSRLRRRLADPSPTQRLASRSHLNTRPR